LTGCVYFPTAVIVSVTGPSHVVQFNCNVLSTRVQPNSVGTTERAIVVVSCGQFSTARIKSKLSTYIQETVGDR